MLVVPSGCTNSLIVEVNPGLLLLVIDTSRLLLLLLFVMMPNPLLLFVIEVRPKPLLLLVIVVLVSAGLRLLLFVIVRPGPLLLLLVAVKPKLLLLLINWGERRARNFHIKESAVKTCDLLTASPSARLKTFATMQVASITTKVICKKIHQNLKKNMLH